MSDIVRLVKEAQESGQWVNVDLAIAVADIKRLTNVLLAIKAVSERRDTPEWNVVTDIINQALEGK
jgi:hypothetical protein